MRIHQLAPDVAAKIAAGEVVERPANVAKELIENSLDAGADEIRVEVREGGQRLLRVTDNGHGIPADDVLLAFERHATSKLSTADDLNHIGTFGFRGEALYSIAAVSQVTLLTRHRSNDFGMQVRVEGSEVVSQQRAGAAVGTMVTAEHLFFNVPARRKYLRKAATEAGRVAAVVQHYALAYPERRFSFVNDGRLVLQSTGSGDLLDVVAKIYGADKARQMVAVGHWPDEAARAGVLDTGLTPEVDFMDDVDTGAHAGPIGEAVRVYGYVGLPSLHRPNRSDINLFVNRRYVEDRSLTHAVVQAFHTLLPGGRYPLGVIFVDLDPARVDVNVHPQKTQVRFLDERQLYTAVQRAVRRSVMEQVSVPDAGLDFAATLRGQDERSGGRASADGEWNVDPDWAARRAAIMNAGRQHAFDLSESPPAIEAQPDRGAANEQSAPPAQQLPRETPPGMSPETPPEPPRQAPLVERRSQLPPLRVVGQAGSMYIIAEGPEGLYLIDQHAAHERILYEKYMQQRYGTNEGAVPRQQLLEPLTLHMGAELTGQVAEHLTALNAIGFEVEPFGGDTFLVRAVPSVLAGQDPLRSVEEIVALLGERRNQVGEELEARLVKMVCKRAAIKAGQQLSEIEMRELIRQLEACEMPRTCPHGRPTMIQLSAGELEKAFGRI
jgi:DNA mismatch repair protein MutL